MNEPDARDQEIGAEMRAAEAARPVRFFLDQDRDCHWYLVPVRRKQEWAAWLNLDSNDERAWTEPAGVIALNRAPSYVTFTDPQFTG